MIGIIDNSTFDKCTTVLYTLIRGRGSASPLDDGALHPVGQHCIWPPGKSRYPGFCSYPGRGMSSCRGFRTV